MKMKFTFIIFFLFLSIDSFTLDTVNQDLLEHAKKYNSSNLNLPELVIYLSQITKNESELAEILFYWISQNIDYDLEKYEDSKRTKKYEDILISRKGVCQDYADLYKELCDIAKIQCFTISGFAKGLGYTNGDEFVESNHAWNIVKINNDYKFVDTTWGSGGINTETNAYVRKIKIEHILTNSDNFSTRRLSENPMWQLRKNPISLKSFNNYESYDEMIPKIRIGYNYKDSIQLYIKLSKDDRRIMKTKSIFQFNKTLENLSQLIYSYSIKAFNLSEGPFDKKRLEKSNRYYKIALKYCKIGIEESDEISQKALWINKGISYNIYRMIAEK